MAASELDTPYRGGFVGARTASRSPSISRTPTPRASSITPIISSSWSGRVPTCSAPSESTRREMLEETEGLLCRPCRHPLSPARTARRGHSGRQHASNRSAHRRSIFISESCVGRNCWPTLSHCRVSGPEGRPRRQPREWVEKFSGRSSQRAMRAIALLSSLLRLPSWRRLPRAAGHAGGDGHRDSAADLAR